MVNKKAKNALNFNEFRAFLFFEIDEFSIFFSRFSAKLLQQAFGMFRNLVVGLHDVFGVSRRLFSL